jgi:hypothetical protein
MTESQAIEPTNPAHRGTGFVVREARFRLLAGDAVG